MGQLHLVVPGISRTLKLHVEAAHRFHSVVKGRVEDIDSSRAGLSNAALEQVPTAMDELTHLVIKSLEVEIKDSLDMVFRQGLIADTDKQTSIGFAQTGD